IETIKYFSKTAKRERAATIVFPPKYDPNQKYPTLYLLHGIGGDEREWLGGAPAEIYGNLIAAGEAAPAIVVIPNIRVRYEETDKNPPPFFSQEHFIEFDRFLPEMRDDLKPYIEKTYPVLPGRENAAVAGLSMGGRSALHVGLNMIDAFAYIGAFEPAPGVLGDNANSGLFTPETLKIADAYKDKTFLEIVRGTRDNVVGENPTRYLDVLIANGAAPRYRLVEGGHDFGVWKDSLYYFAKTIFKGAPKSGAATPAVEQPAANDDDNDDDAGSDDSESQILFSLTPEIAQNAAKTGQFGEISASSDGVLTCKTTQTPPTPWGFTIRFAIAKPVERGDVMLLKFKARTIAARTEAALAVVTA
ncbi:MAG: esterase family protein, partial [Thermoguttaceae bacterium]|nr:esterase family protein [Thermoguttaceae bacterium]